MQARFLETQKKERLVISKGHTTKIILAAFCMGSWSLLSSAAEITTPPPAPEPGVTPEQPKPEASPADQAMPDVSPETQREAESLVNAVKKRVANENQQAPLPPAETNAIRVTHVPETIKNEIREQVKAELHDQIVQDVFTQARNEQWGLPQALPSWVNKFSLKGDMRLREQGDYFDSGNIGCNISDGYVDFNVVNAKGGVGKAGLDRCINTTEDRQRLRTRARLGADAKVNDTLKAVLRISTGNTRDPVSTNQTLGNYGGRYGVVWDEAYLRYDGMDLDRFPWLTLYGGRMANPWLSTDLVWDNDLAFEGLAGTMRFNLRGSGNLLDMNERDRILFLTVGAFPLQEVELSKRDKWLYGVQLGTDLIFLNQSTLRIGLAYYHYENITGVRNSLDSVDYDFTAPGYVQKGNGLFDIRNDDSTSDPLGNSDYWALAADYKLADLTIQYDSLALAPHHIVTTIDVVKNIGYDKGEIWKRTNGNGVQYAGGFATNVGASDSEKAAASVKERSLGYQVMLSYGWPIVAERYTWRVHGEYRYLQRDAVLDAFTDSDFHLGGTDAKGWIIGGDYAIDENTVLSFRYLTSDSIDAAPLSIDSVQLDLSAKF